MASPLPEPSPAPITDIHAFLSHHSDDEDGDTASARSISLSSPASSTRNSLQQRFNRDSGTFSKRESDTYTADTEYSSGLDKNTMFGHPIGVVETPVASATIPSSYEEPTESDHHSATTYPPTKNLDDAASIASFASGSSRKARPESLLVPLPNGPIILGIALVDFNHLIGPHIEYSRGDIMENEEVAKILPFLALPDGAHLSSEDYSYFHLVPAGPNPTTIFGISCNQQISASSLLVKGADVTRSTVQKAVVVLASKPVFGPIRAKLGVVTTALFNQRDFTDNSILDDFAAALEASIRGQLTESALYMGTNLRELVHTFRQRTLVLVKALLLQKRIMFYGHPVERLCTYQYSLVSLLPGLLQTLDDCGSPPLASRAPTLTQATSLKTSDHKSLMAYLGLPLDIFGKDGFFQPYLPLQQLDILKETKSWLCGSTNSIVTHQAEIDLLVNIETGVFEFRDLNLERSAGLTAADRKWMDEIITDVNASWDENNPGQSLQFKGSEDYLRQKFEEYVSAALSSVKYQAFMAKGEGSGVMITGGAGADSTSTEDFNPLWISEFKKTNAFEVWDRITDPVLFDIVEARHPCNEKPSVVSDIGLRLSEGIQELKLEQQLAPAREAVARTFATGSANFFKAVEGVRGRWSQRPSVSAESPSSSEPTSRQSPVEVTKADLPPADSRQAPQRASSSGGLRPFSILAKSPTGETASAPASTQPPHTSPPPSPFGSVLSPASRQSLSSWGSGIGSFISSRAPMLSAAITRRESQDSTASVPAVPPKTEQHEEVPSRVVPVASRRSSARMSMPPPPVVVSSQEEYHKSPLSEDHTVKPNPATIDHALNPSINVNPASPTTPTPIPRAAEAKTDKEDSPFGSPDQHVDLGGEGHTPTLADSAAGHEPKKNDRDSISLNSSRSSRSDYEAAYTGMAL